MKRLLHYSLQLKNLAYSLLLLAAAIALYQLVAFYRHTGMPPECQQQPVTQQRGHAETA